MWSMWRKRGSFCFKEKASIKLAEEKAAAGTKRSRGEAGTPETLHSHVPLGPNSDVRATCSQGKKGNVVAKGNGIFDSLSHVATVHLNSTRPALC